MKGIKPGVFVKFRLGYYHELPKGNKHLRLPGLWKVLEINENDVTTTITAMSVKETADGLVYGKVTTVIIAGPTRRSKNISSLVMRPYQVTKPRRQPQE